MRWGLIPSWSKDVSIGSKMINARSETLADKPAFRAALNRRRCLVVADGFYEWQAQPEGPKQPMYITLKDHAVFGFAGLWERWTEPESGEVSRRLYFKDEIPGESDAGQQVKTAAAVKNNAKKAARR